ncbi:MAG: hypothetical protein V5B36_14445 [Candidatus Accumulibacter sp. UW25]|jgi:hypothetical protein
MMDIDFSIWLSLLLLIAVAWVIFRKGKGLPRGSVALIPAQEPAVPEINPPVPKPDRIVIASNPALPLVTALV